MVLRHPLEACLAKEKQLPPNELHALKMYRELEAEQVAAVLLARWAGPSCETIEKCSFRGVACRAALFFPLQDGTPS